MPDSNIGLEPRITALLGEVNASGGYPLSLVCTDQGLLVASSGDLMSSEQLAGLTSLFDDIVLRSRRDLGSAWVDEVTLLDDEHGRLIVRPIPTSGEGDTRFFLVLRAPPRATWRRNTNRLTRTLSRWLSPLVAVAS